MPGARENTSQQDEIELVKRPITREGSANFQEKGKLTWTQCSNLIENCSINHS